MTRRSVPALLAVLALTACSSSDDGGVRTFFERQGFDSEASFAAGVTAAGFQVSDDAAQQIALTGDDASAFGSVTQAISPAGRLRALVVDSSVGQVAFGGEAGGTVFDDGDFYVAALEDETDGVTLLADGRFADASQQGLEYHNYGAWTAEDSFGNGEFGGVVYGLLTDPLDMPTRGSATYEGLSTGVWIRESNDSIRFTESRVTAIARFGRGEIDFRTFDTASGAVPGTIDRNESQLDMSGRLLISGSQAGGTVLTEGGLVGDAAGVFAGPRGAEFGGTFYTSDNDEAYAGAFGTRQLPGK